MEKAPFIGQMDRKIQLVEKVTTRNSTGEMEVAHNVIAEPFSQMNDVSGSEDVEGDVRHITNRNYVIRYNAMIRLKATELIVFDGSQKLEVYHAIEIGRRRFLKLLVRSYE